MTDKPDTSAEAVMRLASSLDFDTWNGVSVGATLRALLAERDAARALLAEAAASIREYVTDAYPNREKYRSEMLRYQRDMDLPNRIRAALPAPPVAEGAPPPKAMEE